ncbi:hypothetical protein HYPSUDRAFT_41442 [Hypholoma sublateritium FD-334 SS-4]|uniref:Dienelactone hydrolase domain-containing protein n=1 Tax=Hypholoma sublateritium (strain FD-334 SS-4) TaxID=945553 RepID=A0A0D2NT36_HYPSF|nr:hypothetical protein HYPSUDRAFT_41442 [Hypholoma sublateritium FD-334 SS-4]
MSASTDSPLLAGPLGDCCIKGLKHEGEPVGRIETIAGFETYISDPPVGTTGRKKVIIYFADVFGPFYINAKLLQDYFASHGYTVLGVDYFFGDNISSHLGKDGFEMLPWAMGKFEKAQKETPRWIDEVRKIYGEDAAYCAIGYCFGGPFSIEIAATDKVVAAGFAHPGNITEQHLRDLKKPFLLCCAETDQTFPTPARHKAELILAEVKATYHIQVFSGVVHGFATKGDITVENSRK